MAFEVAAQAELIAAFSDKAQSVGTTVEHVAGTADAVELIRRYAAEAGTQSLVVSPQLAETAPGLLKAIATAGIAVTIVNGAVDARDQPLGLSLARLAVAETGSALLSESSLADRAASLMTLHNVILIRTLDLVPALDDAAAVLREMAMQQIGGYGTFVTGPSRSADIEMSLTVGVQGPAQSTVLFVDELP